MTRPADSDTKLTRNQSLVLNTLLTAAKPLSAYSILDDLRSMGVKAPPQVYRALDKLIDFKLIHKLESINSYIVCQNSNCDSPHATSFAICDGCNLVLEMVDDDFEAKIHALAKRAGFNPDHSTIELHGTCLGCLNLG